MLDSKKLNLIVIDDEPGIVSSLSLLINALGHKVIGFTDPVLALAAIKDQTNNFNAILCDLRMPVFSGSDLLKLVLSSGNKTPFIIMSAHAEQDQIDTLIAHGAFDFLSKPFTLDNLKNLLTKLTIKHTANS